MWLSARVGNDLPGRVAGYARTRLGFLAALGVIGRHRSRSLALIPSAPAMSGPEPTAKSPARSGSGRAMFFVRYILPGLIILSGLLVGLIDGRELAWEAGALLMSAGLSVYLLNFLFRLGVRGDRTRDREEAAREHFDRTGHWPDE